VVKKYINILLSISFVSAAVYSGCILPADAYAALVIEPALIQLEMSQNRSSGAFVIKNTGEKEERYRAKAVHFTLTPEGGLKEVAPDEHSLAGWVKFNPKEFVLPPQSSRVIRFSVIPEGKVRPKEYWGAIEFMPLQGAKITTKDSKEHVLNLEILSVVLVPIYGYVEGTKYSGITKGISFNKEKEKSYLTCSLLNTGDGILRLGGSCRITDSSGAVVDEIELKMVIIFADGERILKMAFNKPLAPGKYHAAINLKSFDPHSKVELSGETDFVS